MIPETRFRELLSKLLDGEFSAGERDELARLCDEDESFRDSLRAELELDELIRHAASESEATAHPFSRSLETRISGEMPDFDSLIARFIETEAEPHEVDELARHCRGHEEKASQLRHDLKWSDLLEQASTLHRSEETFIESLESKISGELPDFTSLTERLIDGEVTDEEVDGLARHCRKDETNAIQLSRDLKWADLLEQASAAHRSEDAFIESLESRISLGTPDFDLLTDRLIEGDSNPDDIDELVRLCWRDETYADQLRDELKWGDLLEQASTERRSEDAFVESLATRMWAEQEQDQFVEKTQSKIVSMFPDSVQQDEPESRTSKILSFGTWATAAAAAIVIGVTFLANRPGPAIAEIVNSTDDVRWREAPKDSGHLTKGQYALESGVVTLGFTNGAEMTIEGPAEFDLRGENEAFVHSGIAMLNQDGPAKADSSGDPGPGFNLQSKGLKLVDSHDTVGIDARSASATEAIVFSGDTEVCLPATGGNCRNLYDYEAVRVDLKRDKIYDIPYNPKVFARSWEVLAGVESNAGSVRIELPGEMPEQADSGDKDEVQVFVERDHFVAGGSIEVDTLNPGQFPLASSGKGQALDGTRELRSYLLQLWPDDDSGDDAALEASVTFDHEVVGVIYSSKRLELSDSMVGANVSNLDKEDSKSRGLDSFGSEGDSILLSDNKRTVNLRLQSGTETDKLDHIRVLVALR